MNDQPFPTDILDWLAYRRDAVEYVASKVDHPDEWAEALAQLPDPEFVVVWLFLRKNCSFASIATTLGISQSTAHARWRRALKRMKDDHHGTPEESA